MPRVKADKKVATETKSSSKVVAAAKKQKILENGYQTPPVEEMKATVVEGGRSRGRKVKAEVIPQEEPQKKASAGRGGGRKKPAIAEEQEQAQEEKKQTAKKPMKVVEENGKEDEVEVPATAKNGVVKKTTKGRAKKTSTKSVDVVIEEEEIIEKPAKITKEKKAIKSQKKKLVEPAEELHETPASEEEQAQPKAEAPSAAKPAVKEKAITKSKSKLVKVNTEKKPAAKRGRGSKKDAAAVLEDIIEEVSEDKAEPIESPKKKAKKETKEPKTAPEKKKKKESTVEDKIVNAEIIEPTNKKAATEKKSRSRKRAATDDENASAAAASDNDDDSKPTKTKRATPINATTTLYNKSDFDLTVGNGGASDGKPFTLKISSWNVAGLRSWLKKEGLKYLEYEEPDIFCMQETKCTTEQLPEEATRIPGYHPYWLCMPGGYAGVAIYSKIMPIHVEYGIGNAEFDAVGRLITAEYEKFYLLNVYVPNSGRKLVNLEARMRWEKLFQAYIKKLDALKPVILCGDMNCSHQEIDLANPKSNTRSAGFTQEERDKLTELLSLGFVDTFRHLYANKKGAYTYWTYIGNARSRNVGWRLDYFIVSERVVNRVVDNCIRSQCMGSDHCPITLFLKI